jgi:hypothetical protein
MVVPLIMVLRPKNVGLKHSAQRGDVFGGWVVVIKGNRQGLRTGGGFTE